MGRNCIGMLASSVVLLTTDVSSPAEAAGVVGQTTTAHVSAKAERLDAEVRKALRDASVPSVSVARIERGRIVWARTWGEQSPGKPATNDTLYNVASLSKPISAEAVLRLASLGRLSLDESMSAYWLDPDLTGAAGVGLLTPRIALSHRTGFPNWRSETGGRLSFRWKPGTGVGYSGEGFEYLARFTERRVGVPFERLAEDQVFRPARMSRTAYTGRHWFADHVATPTDASGKGLKSVQRLSYIASDDVHTTAGDYARFLVGVAKGHGLSPSIAAARQDVLASTKDRLCSGAKARTCPDEAGYGLGWEIARFGEKRVLWHTGADEGEFALAYVIPQSQEGMVILTNSAVGYRVVLPILAAAGADPRFLAFLRGQAG